MLYSLIFEKGEGGAESRWVLFNLVRRIYFGLKRLTQPSERKKNGWREANLTLNICHKSLNGEEIAKNLHLFLSSRPHLFFRNSPASETSLFVKSLP